MQCLVHVGRRYTSLIRHPVSPYLISLRTTTDFHQAKRGAEYADQLESKRVTKHLIKENIKHLPEECRKWGQELKDKFVSNPIIPVCHGDYEVLFKFDNKDIINEWVVSTDRDVAEGYSQAELVLGQNKTAIFRGFLNTTVPKDGVIKQTGYCNMRSPPKMLSFGRPIPYDLTNYTHLLFRVRGDGRSYQIHMSMDRYFDVQFHDQYAYTLFTRGGPYWQLAHIPLSKFFLASKGRIQDTQEPVQLHEIQNFGLTIMDGVMGPFQLEIDFITAIKDDRHKEDFAYEMYETSGASLY